MFALEWQVVQWLVGELGLLVFSFDGARLSPFNKDAERFLPKALPLSDARSSLSDAFCPSSIELAHRNRRAESVAWGDGKAYIVPSEESSLIVVHPEQAQSMRSTMATHDTSHALGLVVAWSRVAESSDSGGVQTAMQGIRGAVEAARMALAGKPETRELTPIREVVDEVLKLLEPLATQRSLRVEVAVQDDLIARAPRSVVYRALWNVVENAYSALGAGRSVKIEGDRRGERVVLRVEDDGPGVPPKLIPTLFTKRPDAHHSRGIGLSGVSESLAEIGGSIRLDTAREGPGASFVIELPAEALADQRHSGVRSMALAPNVLVIEDDPALRDLLVATFELEGLSVESRRDDLPDDIHRFDAALIDLRLSTTDGLSLVSTLVKQGFDGALHLMSGGEPPRDVDGTLDFCFHRKPFDPTVVAATVHRSVTTRKTRRTSAAQG
jgi:CheY-like chemotaxis protein